MVALPVINLLPVLGVTALTFVIGMLWYSPLLFGPMWMKALGKTKKQLRKPGPVMIINIAATFILSYILANAVILTQSRTALEGAAMGFFMWLGFVVTTNLAAYLFENRDMKLYYIYVAYQLIALSLSGAVLAVWV